jgi:F0F1-type ATP synthase assembly protein I
MGGVLTTGIGALLGWALDNGHSKPWIRIELPPVGMAVRSQLTF